MTDLPAELRAELVESAAQAIFDKEGPECIDMDGAEEDAIAALDAIAPRLSEHVAGQVREHIAAEIDKVVETLRQFHVKGGEQYIEEWAAVDAAYLADHLEHIARSSRPVVTQDEETK